MDESSPGGGLPRRGSRRMPLLVNGMPQRPVTSDDGFPAGRGLSSHRRSLAKIQRVPPAAVRFDWR